MEDKIAEIEEIKSDIEEEVMDISKEQFDEIESRTTRILCYLYPFSLLFVAMFFFISSGAVGTFCSWGIIYLSFSFTTNKNQDRDIWFAYIYSNEMKKQIKQAKEAIYENINKSQKG